MRIESSTNFPLHYVTSTSFRFAQAIYMKQTSTLVGALAVPALLVSLFQGAIAQAPSAPPPSAATAPATPFAFSIDDVQALPHSKANYMKLSMVNQDRFVLHHATIVDMISLAYARNDTNGIARHQGGNLVAVVIEPGGAA
jgi:hypothetical protein